MEAAVRDVCIYWSGYATAAEGLRALGISAVEVAIAKDGTVRAVASDRTLDLTQPADLTELEAELSMSGARVCAFLCSQNFNGEDRDAQVNWVVQAVRAADALG